MLDIYSDVYEQWDYFKKVLEDLDDATFGAFDETFNKNWSRLANTILAMKGFKTLEEEEVERNKKDQA